MSLLDKLFRKQIETSNPLDNESPGNLMLMGIITSSPIIFDDKWTNYKNRKGQTFELIILSTLLILRKFESVKPQYYHEFEEDLFDQIHKFARREQIIQMLPIDFADFINTRFVLYDNEFSVDDDQQVKIPVHTVFNLFEKPLLKDSGMCLDIFKVMKVQIKFQIYYKRLYSDFDFMISKKYS